MAVHIKQPGDKTSRECKPDFEGERAHHWMHMRRMAEKAGTDHKLPRKTRRGLAEESFFKAVDTRMSRVSFATGVSFDENGRIIR